MTNQTLKILLADDDDDDRLFFKEALEDIKIKTKVHTVNDGTALMEHLNQPGIPLPDMLFLDLNMPKKMASSAWKRYAKTSDSRN